jgi:putative flippase GtrA
VNAFARNTLTSVFTTALDFGALTGLVELFGVNYVVATFVGTVIGATSNFLINRAWSFAATSHAPIHHQALRMLPVQVGSSGLQTLGVWLFTRFAGLPYMASKLVVSVLVYLGWNYPLNRYFVFRAPRPVSGDSLVP